MSASGRSPKRTTAPAPITILDAFDLFGSSFAGDGWRPWRAFLASLFALPMDAEALALYRRHTGRQAPPDRAFREAALVIGRRGGKSRVLGLLAVYAACFRSYVGLVAPGETVVVAVIARDRVQARVILGYALGLLRSVPALAALIADELTESVRLTNGVTIEVHTGSVGAPRGRTFAAVLADEIAFWPAGAEAAAPDRAVIAAVRPGLATLPNSMLIMASSPYAKRGVLYDTFRRHYGRDGSRILVWKATTLEMNPGLNASFIEEAREEDPDSARAEYDAEFRDDVLDYVSREAVEACVARGVYEILPVADVTYHGAVDVAGGSGGDAFVSVIGHVEADGLIVIDCIRETRPPFSPDAVVADHAAGFRAYKVSRVRGDKWAGLWPVESFASYGILYEQSAVAKTDQYQALLPLINGRRVQLLDHPRLVAQACALERRTSRSGKDSIAEPSGAHDDLVNAAALCVTTIATEAAPTLIRRADIVRETVDDPGAAPLTMVYGVHAVDVFGSAAVIYVGVPRTPRGELVILDFDRFTMGAEVIDGIAARLVELVTAARRRIGNRRVGCWLWTPEAWRNRADNAVDAAFSPMIERREIATLGVEAISAKLLADPTRLLFSSGAHTASGAVKFSAAALDKAQSTPIFGALSYRPGMRERIEDDALRHAALLAIALGLDVEGDALSPALPAARMVTA